MQAHAPEELASRAHQVQAERAALEEQRRYTKTLLVGNSHQLVPQVGVA